MYRLLLRSCKLMGAFIIYPCLPFCWSHYPQQGLFAPRPLRRFSATTGPSATLSPFHRFPGFASYTASLLPAISFASLLFGCTLTLPHRAVLKRSPTFPHDLHARQSVNSKCVEDVTTYAWILFWFRAEPAAYLSCAWTTSTTTDGTTTARGGGGGNGLLCDIHIRHWVHGVH